MKLEPLSRARHVAKALVLLIGSFVACQAAAASVDNTARAASPSVPRAGGPSFPGPNAAGEQKAVAHTVAAKLADFVSIKDFGAIGDGTADDSTAIQAAITAFANGGTLWLPAGVYKTTTCLTLRSNVRFLGQGNGEANEGAVGAVRIRNAASDLFCSGASHTYAVVFDGFVAESEVGGGHIFNFSGPGAVSNIEFRNVVLIQRNRAKAILQATSAGGVFEISMHHFNFLYAASNSVPALNFSNPALSHVAIEHFIAYGADTTSGTYAIRFEGTNNHRGATCVVRDGAFEQTTGGAVDYLSMVYSGIESSQTWDFHVRLKNPLVHFGKSSTNSAGTSSVFVASSNIEGGDASVPDVQFDPSGGGHGLTIRESHVTWLDGVAAGSTKATIINSVVENVRNMAYQSLGGSGDDDLCFRTTSKTGRDYCFSHGGPAGGGDGYLQVLQNGRYVGGVNPAGSLIWGGTPGRPDATLASGVGDGISVGTGTGQDGKQIGGAAGPGAGETARAIGGYGILLASGNRANAHIGMTPLRIDPRSLSNGDLWVQGENVQELKFRDKGVTHVLAPLKAGVVALSSGKPSTATVTLPLPDMVCTCTETTNEANNLLKCPVSGTKLEISGPDFIKDAIAYTCMVAQ
jgi:Pectate lyase superfamily protein